MSVWLEKRNWVAHKEVHNIECIFICIGVFRYRLFITAENHP